MVTLLGDRNIGLQPGGLGWAYGLLGRQVREPNTYSSLPAAWLLGPSAADILVPIQKRSEQAR
jgi:hypothetical protein